MDLTFIPIAPIWLFIVGFTATVIAATAATVYVLISKGVSAATIVTYILRVLALLSLGAFLLQPHIVRDSKRVGDIPVAILMDVSESMTLDDGSNKGTSRLERGIDIAESIHSKLENSNLDTAVFLFADGIRSTSLGDILDVSNSIASDRTDLSNALEYVGLPAAAIVISDGNFSSGIQEREYPVYYVNPVIRGATGLELMTTVAPRRVLPGTEFQIEVFYNNTGIETTTIQLYEGKKKIVSRKLSVNSGYNSFTVSISAQTPGYHFYEISSDDANASVSVAVEVIAGPIKVWYHSSGTDFDASYLRRAMAANSAVDLTYIADGSGDIPVTETDIIVLANPGDNLERTVLNEIERRVTEGAGLFILVSADNPDEMSLNRPPLSALLPVSGEASRQPGKGGSTNLKSNPNFASSVLPDFTHSWNLGSPKLATDVLWSINGVPVLSWMPYGSGKVMLLSGGGLYSWENKRLSDTPGLEELAATFLVNIYGDNEDNIKLSKLTPTVGEEVELSLRSEGEPTLIISGIDDVPRQLQPIEIRPRVWRARFRTDKLGEHKITARYFDDNTLIVRDTVLMSTPDKTEMSKLTSNVELMKTAGDGYFEYDEIDSLISVVDEAVKLPGDLKINSIKERLLPQWIWIGLFILLLTVEWIIRRLTGLA